MKIHELECIIGDKKRQNGGKEVELEESELSLNEIDGGPSVKKHSCMYTTTCIMPKY